MKRSEALIPLSHDHHQTLYLAKRLRDAAESGVDMEKVADDLEKFWNNEGQGHFRAEEEILLPASGLPGPSVDGDVARMLDEHLEIRRLVARVTRGEVTPDLLQGLSDALTAHVRFEERELFTRIEAELSDVDLSALGSALAGS